MQTNIIDFSNYHISIQGKLYKLKPVQEEIQADKEHRFFIVDDKGKPQRITQKKLYRMAYNKEYSIDTIENLNGEEWKEIDGEGKYFISSCGRVKTYCGYYAKILKPYIQNKYYQVKINGKNFYIHQLVAAAFCKREDTKEKTEVHHKDRNTLNNNRNNLIILTAAEHRKEHRKKKKEK